MAKRDCFKVETGGHFCFQRPNTKKCKCGNDYTAHNKDIVEKWGKYLQSQRNYEKEENNKKKNKLDANGKKILESVSTAKKSAEHHHILTVASIQKLMTSIKVNKVAHSTKWCINAKPNLVTLPKWPMTLKHYCEFIQGPKVKETWDSTSQYTSTPCSPPPFENLPMHDYDHNSDGGYIDEVDEDLSKIEDELEELTECTPAEGLIILLNKVMELYAKQLKENGEKLNGTHAAWDLGINFPESNWYEPFSMSRAPNKKTHPAMGKDSDLSKNMEKYRESVWCEDNPMLCK